MAICSHCGAITESAFCGSCGKSVSPGAFPGEQPNHERDEAVVVDADYLKMLQSGQVQLGEKGKSGVVFSFSSVKVGQAALDEIERLRRDQEVESPHPKYEVPPVDCPGCGAPLNGWVCRYCGTQVPKSGAGAGQPAVALLSEGLQDNVAAGFCYALGLITGMYFLLTDPYSRNAEVRFHALQSIYLSLATLTAVYGLPFVLALAGPSPLGTLVMGFSSLAAVLSFFLWVTVMVRAFNGKKLVLPIVGWMAQVQAG
jgi:uncharacterized membrane protein